MIMKIEMNHNNGNNGETSNCSDKGEECSNLVQQDIFRLCCLRNLVLWGL